MLTCYRTFRSSVSSSSSIILIKPIRVSRHLLNVYKRIKPKYRIVRFFSEAVSLVAPKNKSANVAISRKLSFSPRVHHVRKSRQHHNRTRHEDVLDVSLLFSCLLCSRPAFLLLVSPLLFPLLHRRLSVSVPGCFCFRNHCIVYSYKKPFHHRLEALPRTSEERAPGNRRMPAGSGFPDFGLVGMACS